MTETACRIAENVAIPLMSVNGRDRIEARFVSFDGLEAGKEHIAVLYPGWENGAQPPLVRLHSECLTGDLFASRRCDCGPQLRQAQAMMEAEGGILLYLRQEGRGIGLYEKLAAYRLQSGGLDTYAANRRLGHAEDARDFTLAAHMLKALGIAACRLLTNNPEKVAALKGAGIAIPAVLHLTGNETETNRAYIAAKRQRGHAG